MKPFREKVVVITGGSSGIGFACANAFLKQGAKVVISGRNAGSLHKAVQDLSVDERSLRSFKGDVTSEADCKALIDFTVKNFGGIDVLVNNAGISMRSVFADTHLDVLRQLMDTNFWGTVYCSKFALPFLLKSKGSLVGISSIAGKIGLPARSGYSASKYAMEGFLETIRNENRNLGLHVLVVCPGFTASNIRNTALSKDGTPQGESPLDEQKIMPASEVAVALLKAVQYKKRDLLLSSEGKLAVWIKKFAPSFIDKMVFRKMSEEKNSPLMKQ